MHYSSILATKMCIRNSMISSSNRSAIIFSVRRNLASSSLENSNLTGHSRIIQLNKNKERSEQRSKENADFLGNLRRRLHMPSFKSLFFLVFPATTFCLGVWQNRRLYWKRNLIAEIQAQQEIPAVDFPFENLSQLDNLEYRRVHLRGRFLYDRQFVIRNRGRFDKAFEDYGQGLMGAGKSSSQGSHVICPMELDGTGLIIMVNRGWLPPEKVGSELAKDRTRSSEVVEFDAVVRKPEKPSTFMPKNVPEQGKWFYKDFREMGQFCGAAPILLDQVYDTNSREGPIGGQTNIALRNEHLNYLIFWFSLSAISTCMWIFKFVLKS